MNDKKFKDQLDRLANHRKHRHHDFSMVVGGAMYTVINHQQRKALDLSLVEYCVTDAIYNFSSSPKSKEIGGWCFAKKEFIADCLSLELETVEQAVDRLIERGFVIMDPATKFLRTDDKWYLEIVAYKN